MTEFERRKMEKQVLFEEGFERIVRELEGYAIFDNYIGHVSNEKAASMMYALDTSDSAKLINALVNICIKAMQKAVPTDLELMMKLFNVENELNNLKVQNKQLTEQLETSQKVLEMLQGTNKQRTLVQNGQKISYNEEIQPGAVMDLLRKGMSISKIAEYFGVSRNLIYRRIEELEKAGIDVEAVRKKK